MSIIEMLGSVIFDVFVPKRTRKQEIKDFVREVEKRGGKVDVSKGHKKSTSILLRVNNNGEAIPLDALEYAQSWAESNLYDHAYK